MILRMGGKLLPDSRIFRIQLNQHNGSKKTEIRNRKRSKPECLARTHARAHALRVRLLHVTLSTNNHPCFNHERVGHYSTPPLGQFSTPLDKIMNEVYSKCSKFRKGNPLCFLYSTQTTTGKWVDDNDLKVRTEAQRLDLLGTRLFRDVIFECLGADQLQRLYRSTKTERVEAARCWNQRLALGQRTHTCITRFRKLQ